MSILKESISTSMNFSFRRTNHCGFDNKKREDNKRILMELKIISLILIQIILLPQLLRFMMIYITPEYVGEEKWKVPTQAIEIPSSNKIMKTKEDVINKNLPGIGDREREIARDYKRFCN